MHTSSLPLRRLFCCNASASAQTLSKKKPLVFMGSPKVSATVLDALLKLSSLPNSDFEVAAIFTQPPSKRERGRKLLPSPVAEHALERGFPSDLILTPERAGEEIFLSNLRDLQPELCVTAAYGNILPTKFLKIPKLVPATKISLKFKCNICRDCKYTPKFASLISWCSSCSEGIAGVKETGVSLAFTIRALDAGPVIAYERVKVDDQIKAPELLDLLFSRGSELLIRELPYIFDGSAKLKAQPQDDSKVTLAPKVTPEDSWLSFDQDATLLHNKVRALAGWPGTRAKIAIIEENGECDIVDIKIITTRVSAGANVPENEVDDLSFIKGALVIPCGGGSTLEVLELQLPAKKVVNADSFRNGLRGRKLKKL